MNLHGKLYGEEAAILAFDPTKLMARVKTASGEKIVYAHELKDVREAGEPGGFTGEIKDRLGRRRRFVNGKPVAIGDDQGGEAAHAPSIKVHGEDATVLSVDPKSGLARVKTPSGEKVVKTEELAFDNPDEKSWWQRWFGAGADPGDPAKGHVAPEPKGYEPGSGTEITKNPKTGMVRVKTKDFDRVMSAKEFKAWSSGEAANMDRLRRQRKPGAFGPNAEAGDY